MKVKIIKNAPPQDNDWNDISEYIGQEFYVSRHEENNNCFIIVHNNEFMVYDGEYEIVK